MKSIQNKIDALSKEQLEEVFNCHLDGGTFEYPYLLGYHENGVSSITQSFKTHILESNLEMLLKISDITSEELSKIDNPRVITSWNAYFPNGVVLKSTHSWRIKKEMKRQFNVPIKNKKRDKTPWYTKARDLDIEITTNSELKYTIQWER